MGSILFAQPWFLFGLAAAALPVLIHLIHRQKRKRLRFSTLRFLLLSDKRSARRHRLVDILVLLLRTALLIFLALALAQPLLRPPGAEAGRFGEMSLAVIVDDSMSMRRSEGGVALFDKALEAARRIVTEIPQEGEACVLLTSGRTPAQLATPTAPPESVAGLLDGLECSYGGRPLGGSIHKAVDVLSGSKFRNRVIVLISDLGASAFADADSLNRERLGKEVGSLYVVDVGAADMPNMALRRLTGSPSTAFPGTPLSIRAEILGVGPAPPEALASFWIGEEKIAEQEVALAPGQPATTAFEHAIQQTGDVRASVRLQPDGLTADDTRYLVFRMLPTVRAVIVAPPGARAELGDEALFLKTALNPLLTPTTSGASPVTVALSHYLNFRAETLAGKADAVFLIYDPSIPPGVFASIRQYVAGGGAAVVFPSAELTRDATALTRLQQSSYAEFKVSDLWAAGAGQTPAGLGEVDERHPIFSLLIRSAPQLFGAVTSQRYLALDENSFDAYTRVLGRFADGAPFVVERRIGNGGLIAFTTGCHPAWSDLPLRPLFLPLLYETLKYARGNTRAVREEASVDDGFSLELPKGSKAATVAIANPAGMEDRIDISPGQTKLDYSNTAVPGFYSVRWLGEEAEPEIVAVNASSTESGSERIGPEDLRAYFPEPFGAAAERDVGRIVQRLGYASKGVALSGPLLWLALATLLVEAYLANVLLRAAEEQPSWLRRLRQRLGPRYGGVTREE